MRSLAQTEGVTGNPTHSSREWQTDCSSKGVPLTRSTNAAARTAELESAMARHGYSPDSLIEILHVAQKLDGYLDRAILELIARKLKLPPSRVLGVATFYHLFTLTPPSPHRVTVCAGTACYVAGSARLLENAEKHCAGSKTVRVGCARCIGSCGLAPIISYDGQVMGEMTPERLDTILAKADEKP